jgi:hypothetical protein
MPINQLLEFLQTELGELNWTISPDLNLGIISTNAFEINKNQAKLATLIQKLEKNQTNSDNENFQNPADLANFLTKLLQDFLPDMNIKATGPYINLDLKDEKWKNLLEK